MKMFLILALSSLFITTSFAGVIRTHSGQGNETENGIENCGAITQTTQANLVNLQLFGLGERVAIKVVENGKFSRMAQTMDSPKSLAKVSGVMVNGKPVSFKIEIDGEKMSCKL